MMTGDREEVRIAEVGRIVCSAATREEVAAHKMAEAAIEVETEVIAVTAVDVGIMVVAEEAKMGTRAPEGRCHPLAMTIKISSQRRRC
jgi:spore maturation protein SpmA